MRKFAFALLVGAVAMYPMGAFSTSLIDFNGYSFEDTGFPISNVGDELSMVAQLTGLTSPLQWDPANNQYTLYLGGLISEGQIEPDPNNIVVTYHSGMIGLYEDAFATGTLAEPGENPPNATSPATYIDSDEYLMGDTNEFRVFYNTQFNSGAFEANVTFTGGGHLGDLGPQTTGYTFGGMFQFGYPLGYDLQWDGQILLDPVAVEPTTWGAVKSAFNN